MCDWLVEERTAAGGGFGPRRSIAAMHDPGDMAALYESELLGRP
jgi:hypothetical protein